MSDHNTLHDVIDDNADVNANLKNVCNLLLSIQAKNQSDADARHIEVINRFDDLQQKYEVLRADHNELEIKCGEMSEEIVGLKDSLGQIQQRMLSSNVIIRGIAELEQNKEQLDTLVAATFTALQIPSEANNIVRSSRLGKRSKDTVRPILVHLSNEMSKLKVMQAKRQIRLNCQMIKVNNKPLSVGDEPVYVEEHLTRQNSSLFAEARKLKTDNIVKFAWTSGGSVLVRRKEAEPAHKIRTQTDIEQLRDQPNGQRKKGSSGVKRKQSPSKTDRNTRQKTAAAAMLEATLATAANKANSIGAKAKNNGVQEALIVELD